MNPAEKFPISGPLDWTSAAYLDAYSRINGMVIVGEGIADRHFRLLADAIPEDRDELHRLAAMEGRHAKDFLSCGRNLGVKADVGLAKSLFDPLHRLFLERNSGGDLPSCLVIQGLVVECFALAAYGLYLPVADSYAARITSAVIGDEGEHLCYAETWLSQRFESVEAEVAAVTKRALPLTTAILKVLWPDLQAIGIDPEELLARFASLFQQALERAGFEAPAARRLLASAAARSITQFS